MDTLSSKETQEKIDFFLVSAHELRTSLTAMKWLFKMLLEGDFGTLNETQAAMLKQATNSNERMIALVNDTMTVVKTSDTTPYAHVPLSLSELTEESIKDFTSEAAVRGIHIRYTSHPTPVMVIGDIDKLRIVIHNLFENAIKYGSSDSDIGISFTVTDNKVALSVADHGVIIPPDEQSRIFEKFFRASNIREEYLGVGLGLYATKHIVERHGGKITFVSTREEGTIFTMTLPLG